ncbi:MAG: hypothetical protein NC338_00295 [Firmicutes bacterium]|nr:hypothetical protein [Bacillota bacterium]MCM1400747.1 hypothetical protein [Bacteroides sp.]MCM1476834.1 hypothetical protein [Bacteroides sp.]
MKLKYYFLSMALMATACVSFTACDDDDPVDEPVYVIPGTDSPDITLNTNSLKVKVGAANKVALPVEQSGEQVKAFSLNTSIATVVTEGDTQYIEGVANGTTDVVISDANGDYKTVTVEVYTYDAVLVNQNDPTYEAPLGVQGTIQGLKVTQGNGGYSIESNNTDVTATINSETGEVTLQAIGRMQPYQAIITITDMSGFSTDVNVTIKALTNAGFTAGEIQTILDQKTTDLFAQVKDPSDGNAPYYYGGYYGDWMNSDADGVHTLGWWFDYYGTDYGGLKVEYPSTAAVDAEVSGTLHFQYSNIAWWPDWTYDGTVKVLVNDSTRIVAIFWQIDTTNQRVNRAWFVYYK